MDLWNWVTGSHAHEEANHFNVPVAGHGKGQVSTGGQYFIGRQDFTVGQVSTGGQDSNAGQDFTGGQVPTGGQDSNVGQDFTGGQVSSGDGNDMEVAVDQLMSIRVTLPPPTRYDIVLGVNRDGDRCEFYEIWTERRNDDKN